MATKNKRKHRFVVGYKGDGNPAYGKDRNGKTQYIDLMTEWQAKQYQKRMPCENATIYELVPVAQEAPHGK